MSNGHLSLRKKLNISEKEARKLIAMEEMIYEQTADSQTINQIMELYTAN